MKLTCATLLLLGLVCSSSAFNWKECGQGQTKIESVSLTPDPPVPGATANFGIKGSSDAEVDGGTLSLAVAFMGFPIWSQAFNLCDRTQCPVKEGPVELAVSEYLPPVTPPGAYNVTITAQTTTNVQLLCLQVDFEVKPIGPTPPDDVADGSEIESQEVAEQVEAVAKARGRPVQIS